MSRKLLLIVFGTLGVVVIIGGVAAFMARGDWEEPAEISRQITTSRKEVKLTYSDYPKEAVHEISSFEEEQDIRWQGDGFYDNRNVFAGKTSLELTSSNHEPGIAFTEELPSMSNFKNLEVGVNITDVADLESLIVYAGTKDTPEAYSFSINNLSEQWNIVRMSRDKFTPLTAVDTKTDQLDWNEVNRLEFKLLSRPGSTIIINLDELRLEDINDYMKDWNVNVDTFLGIGALNDQIFLSVRGSGAPVATIESIPSTNNFTYRAKVIPMSDKHTGLFFRGDYRSGHGYIFWIGGFDQNTWGLHARQGGIENILATGALTNVLYRRGEPVWLQITAKGETVKAEISFDGEHYDTLADITDSALLELIGGVGVYAEGGAISLFNDFYFVQ